MNRTLLDRAQTATVILDAHEMGADRCTAAIHSFFSAYGIRAEVFAMDCGKGMLYLSDLSDARIVKSGRSALARSEDIYVNLCHDGRKALAVAHKKNRSTKAEIRISRKDSKSRPYDVVVSGTEDAILKNVFMMMENILKSIA